MHVVKRDGRKEEVHFDKITARIRKLTDGLDKRFIDPVRCAAERACAAPTLGSHYSADWPTPAPSPQTAVAMKVVQGIYNGVTTRELDQLAAETCAWRAHHRVVANNPRTSPHHARALTAVRRRLLVDLPPRLVHPRRPHRRVGPPEDDRPALLPQRQAPARARAP